ncbi:MAG: tripartite tricarboxylate transporter substrate binding protein [Ottowia sp.]|uniref:Bug family tripartite tricarboxylate transporter substrate binding protein n=1 Tax=Ottowia sp. TaxID=1898956 RepID=UPI003C779B18
MRGWLKWMVLVCAGLLPFSWAHAQAYPNKPIRLVVSYAPGGITDIIGRVVAQGLSKQLGQPVVVDNKPGASGMIGHEMVARSAPDGYTLVLATGGAMTINIQMVEKPRFNPLKDFTSIGLVTTNDSVLVVSPGFPAANFKEFVEVVKKAPGKYSFASAGIGLPTHLGGELLKKEVGLDMVHVPYKGDALAVVDVMSGQIPMMVAAYGSISNYIKSGQVRPIAVMSPKRIPLSPDVPTVAEMGYPGFVAMTWGGIAGPAGLPPEVVQRLSTALHATMNDPEVKARYASIGSNLANSTPAEMDAFVKSETGKWGAIIKQLGLKSTE